MKADLNPPQREAALHGEGPLLILAGAGSGKTRVLTYRIARLIEEGLAEPREILALTFTNKAAKEMAERVSALLGGRAPAWITTFHSACVRILRREADRIGWPKTFVILDDQDQIALLKRCLKLLELDDKRFPPKALRDRINAARNDLREPGPSSPYFAQQEKQIFDLYEARKKESGALDFGDLIAKTVLLFEKNPDVLKRYADQFRWIVVDEYQDTNHAQYRLLQLLTQERKNLCVVGDDDQSIYRWRGADLSNILNFERDNPGCKVVKLEENYRSTQNVLAAANAIVQTISGRKPKTLWTKRHHGSPIYLYVGEDERDEAAFVAGRLSVYAEDGKLSECAVFYRANAQSRVAEEELARRGIPYKVLGGTRFYDRAEIKDALAYLRIVLNPRDDVSALRIVNTPARGLGDKTLAQADETMRIERCGALDALGFMAARGQLSGKAEASVRALLASHEQWRAKAAALPLGELFQTVLEESGYLKMLEEEGTDQALGRLENLEELRAAAEEFQGRWDAGTLEREPGATALSAFLDQAALVSDQDAFDPAGGRVSLMTVHTAKGLEFDTVFILGMEEGVFPHARALQSGYDDDLDEERRLCYVGLTRARDRLFLLRALRRSLYGPSKPNPASRFLKEIPANLVQDMTPPERRERWEEVEADMELGGLRVDSSYSQMPASWRSKSGAIRSATTRETTYEPDTIVVGELEIGAKVRHPHFGEGVVRGTEGSGDRLKLTIEFQDAGIKKVMARLANLEIL